jgi:hypothetical protein
MFNASQTISNICQMYPTMKAFPHFALEITFPFFRSMFFCKSMCFIYAVLCQVAQGMSSHYTCGMWENTEEDLFAASQYLRQKR